MPESEADIVYLAWHTDVHEDAKLLGVYSARLSAELAIERIKTKPGFAEGDAFEIAEYKLDQDHWTDGFLWRDGVSLPAWFRPKPDK